MLESRISRGRAERNATFSLMRDSGPLSPNPDMTNNNPASLPTCKPQSIEYRISLESYYILNYYILYSLFA